MERFIMYRRNALLAATVILFSFTSLSKAQEEKRDVSGFDKISYSISGDLEISQGSTEELILIGDPEDLEKVETKVEGTTLKIYLKSNFSHIGKVQAKVTVKQLNKLSIAGSGNVVFKTGLKTEDFELELSGSGNVDCPDLTAGELDIDLAGSGNIKFAGELSGELEINIAGSGNIDCSNLKTKEAEVNIAGSGDVKVWATDELESNIVGSGSVYYKGNPLVDTETSGSGKTKPL